VYVECTVLVGVSPDFFSDESAMDKSATRTSGYHSYHTVQYLFICDVAIDIPRTGNTPMIYAGIGLRVTSVPVMVPVVSGTHTYYYTCKQADVCSSGE
jgi:hypothetical protein